MTGAAPGVARVRVRLKGTRVYALVQSATRNEGDEWLIDCAREAAGQGWQGWAFVSFRVDDAGQTHSRASFFWPANVLGPIYAMPGAVHTRLVERIADKE